MLFLREYVRLKVVRGGGVGEMGVGVGWKKKVIYMLGVCARLQLWVWSGDGLFKTGTGGILGACGSSLGYQDKELS